MRLLLREEERDLLAGLGGEQIEPADLREDGIDGTRGARSCLARLPEGRSNCADHSG